MSAAAARAQPIRPTASPTPQPPRAKGESLRGQAPRIALHCFWESEPLRDVFQRFVSDRRMSRTLPELRGGGLDAAAAAYAAAPSPDLVIVESRLGPDLLPVELDRLAEVCEPHTRVIVVGEANDIALYRRLMAAGVEDYLLAPVEPLILVERVLSGFAAEDAAPLGRVVACVGARGGVGSSAVAQNVAWAMAKRGRGVLLADLDLAAGVAALNVDVEAGRGVAEALAEAERLDAALLDRLAVARGRSLSVLAAPARLEAGEQVDATSLERLLEVARGVFPTLVLDLPRLWTDWTRAALRSADAVILTATPSLAAVRSAAGLLDALAEMRPNDPPPRLVLNKVGLDRREPRAAEIESILKTGATALVPFEPGAFGEAAGRGLMIDETTRAGRLRRPFETIAEAASRAGDDPAERPRRWRIFRR